jgi:hypothetical protein
MLAALYTDEDMSALVATLLKSRGLDVTTVPEQATLGNTDSEQLKFATSLGRCLLTGLRQKTIRKQPQTQVAQGIYTKHEKIAETQVYQENYQIEVKPLLYIGLRLFLTKKCLSPVNSQPR